MYMIVSYKRFKLMRNSISAQNQLEGSIPSTINELTNLKEIVLGKT